MRAIEYMYHSKPKTADPWRHITWAEFCIWAQGRKIVQEVDKYDGELALVFDDGSIARVRSNYDGPYSDVTPGNGIQAPTVRVQP